MSLWQQHVLAHGPLTAIGPRLWYVTGRLPRGSLPRNMVVWKTSTGGLLIHSGVAVNDQTLGELTKLGKPEVLIVPCAFHRLDAGAWKERFPALKVVAPRAAMTNAAKAVAIDGACEDLLPAFGVRCHAADGLKPSELCYEVDSGDGPALIVTDMLMNLEHMSGMDGLIMKLLGSSGFFGMTRIGRLLLLKDRAAFKAWLLKMAELPQLKAVCVGHGAMVTSACRPRLQAAAARL